MLISQEVEVAVSRFLNYYEDLGYDIPKYYNENNRKWLCKKGTKILVKVEHLPINSHVKVDVLCDYCLEEGIEKHIPQRWQTYNHSKNIHIIDKDCCKKHVSNKSSESNMINYGVKNQFERTEVKEKSRKTNLDKYGVEWYTQTDEYKQRHKETCLDKYGYDNVSKVPEFIDKIKNTQFERYGMFYAATDEGKEKFKEANLDKYGVENLFQSEIIKDKIKKTNLERYGVENPQQNSEIRKRTQETLKNNGNICTSKQQIYLFNLFGGFLNYTDNTTGVYFLDIAFPESKIYIEYNGGGHNLIVKNGNMTEGQFMRREMNRYYYLKRNRWKQINIISLRDYLPSDEVLLEEFDNALIWLSINEKYHSHYNIEIGRYADDYQYGHLRFIKNNDLKVANE